MPDQDTESLRAAVPIPDALHSQPITDCEARSLQSLAGDWCFNSLLVAFFVFSGYLALFGARIPVAAGLGYDGQAYGWMAHDFGNALRTQSVSGYSLKRCVPSLAVGLSLKALGLSCGPREIVLGFAVLNLVLLVATVPVWQLICHRLLLPKSAVQIGLACLLINYGHLRDCYFYPVSTDVSAFFLSLVSLALYLYGKMLSLALVSLFCLFTWPTVLPLSAAYLLFPFRAASSGIESVDSVASGRTPLVPALLASAFALLQAIFLYVYWKEPYLPEEHCGHATPLHKTLLPLSLALSSLYVAWLVRANGSPPLTAKVISAAGAAQGGLMLLGYLVISRVLTAFADPADAFGIAAQGLLFFRSLLLESVARPAMFCLPHVVFFGPAILAVVVFSKQIFDTARPYPALYWGIMLLLVFTLLSESRQAAFFLPPAILGLCMALPQTWFARTTGCEWALLSWLSSRFWLDLSLTGTAADWEARPAFPSQWYFMQHGPWMNDIGYLIGVVQTLIVIGLMGMMILRRARGVSAGDLAGPP